MKNALLKNDSTRSDFWTEREEDTDIACGMQDTLECWEYIMVKDLN